MPSALNSVMTGVSKNASEPMQAKDDEEAAEAELAELFSERVEDGTASRHESRASDAEVLVHASDDEEDACAELAELFGEEVPNPTDDNTANLSAASPVQSSNEMLPARSHVAFVGREKQQSDKPRRGILQGLLEREGSLTGPMASIVADARSAIEKAYNDEKNAKSEAASRPMSAAAEKYNATTETSGLSMAELMRRRRRRGRDGANNGISDEARRKKARNAFAIAAVNQSDRRMRHYGDMDDARFSGIALSEAKFDELGLASMFDSLNIVNIADVPEKFAEIRARQINEFVIFGCLVQKHSKKTAKNGKRFAVWTLSNIPLHVQSKILYPLTSINCLVFDDAYEDLHTQVPGTVFALRKPGILPPRETEQALGGKDKHGHSKWSGYCLRLTKSSHVKPIGLARHYGICTAETPQGTTCGAWFHLGISSLCHRHTREKLRKLTATSRMDINNAVRPSVTQDVYNAHVNSGTNLSRTDAPIVQSDRYASQIEAKDDMELAKMQKDAKLTDKLNSLRRVASQPLKKEEHRDVLKSRNRRVPAVKAGNASVRVASPGGGESTFEKAARSQNLAAQDGLTKRPALPPRKPFGQARPQSAMRKPASPQELYLKASRILVQLGFTHNKDGGFNPPTCQRQRENALELLRGSQKSTVVVPTVSPLNSTALTAKLTACQVDSPTRTEPKTQNDLCSAAPGAISRQISHDASSKGTEKTESIRTSSTLQKESQRNPQGTLCDRDREEQCSDKKAQFTCVAAKDHPDSHLTKSDSKSGESAPIAGQFSEQVLPATLKSDLGALSGREPPTIPDVVDSELDIAAHDDANEEMLVLDSSSEED